MQLNLERACICCGLVSSLIPVSLPKSLGTNFSLTFATQSICYRRMEY